MTAEPPYPEQEHEEARQLGSRVSRLVSQVLRETIQQMDWSRVRHNMLKSCAVGAETYSFKVMFRWEGLLFTRTIKSSWAAGAVSAALNTFPGFIVDGGIITQRGKRTSVDETDMVHAHITVFKTDDLPTEWVCEP